LERLLDTGYADDLDPEPRMFDNDLPGRLLGKLQRKVEGVERKLEWELIMRKEVQVLRSYLSEHVGSLNMRLSILGL
jgi:hypothetical protein